MLYIVHIMHGSLLALGNEDTPKIVIRGHDYNTKISYIYIFTLHT